VKRFILTGAPGAGKTAILRQLEIDGFSVVEEAATDVIALWQAQGVAEPWTRASFIDAVTDLQRQRQLRASPESCDVQFHDRSVICTAALAAYLGSAVTGALSQEIERVRSENIFRTEVFFIRNLGFIVPSAARRISFEESLRFERIHEETYRSFGFRIISVEPGNVIGRALRIQEVVRQQLG